MNGVMAGRTEHRYPSEAELAVAASAAALSLDRQSRGASTDLKPVVELVEMLNGRLELAGERQQGLLDPITAQFFRRALVLPEDQERSVQAIREAASSFLERLAQALQGSKDVSLPELRDTCVALSQSAQASMNMFFDERPRHPNKRVV